MSAAADIIRQAAGLNREDDRRRGSTVRLDGRRDVIVTGDVHGNRANLAKIIKHASLAADANRCLVLQELIHGPVDAAGGHDRSVEMLLRAARLKCAHGPQVLFVLGNHDVAQITGNEIVKNGHGYCKAFTKGVRYSFGEADADEVLAAVEEFLLSLPLAVACENGVLIAHSVPSPKRMDQAGTDILTRPITPEDLRRGAPAYEWTWGRRHTPEQLDALAGQLGVEFFVLGHQHVSTGFEILSPRAVAIASDHAHGHILQFSTEGPLSAETAQTQARPIAALGADH